MHANVFRYVVLVYAFAFVAFIAFDTDQRFLKWGSEARHPVPPITAKASTQKNVTPADSKAPAGLPEVAKDI